MRTATGLNRSLPLTLFFSVAAISLILCAGSARAEQVVYSGTSFNIEVSSTVDLGIGSLAGITLTAVAVGDYKPNGFDSVTSILGITTTDSKLHQIYQVYDEDLSTNRTPTLTLDESQSYQPSPFPYNLDTHFLITTGETGNSIPGGIIPNENRTTTSSPVSYGGYGNKLYGQFVMKGAPSTSWDFAYLVAPIGTQVNLNFTLTGVKGAANEFVTSEAVTGSFTVTPEPGTITMLCTGAVLAIYLLRRRKS
jgi:hypothetical protein